MVAKIAAQTNGIPYDKRGEMNSVMKNGYFPFPRKYMNAVVKIIVTSNVSMEY